MTEQKIIVGKFINNLDSEDLTSEKLQGVVNNVYAKAISSHKKKEKEVEDNTKDLEKETVEFIKSNHDRLKAHKNKPEKDLNKDDAPVKDKVVKDINESVEKIQPGNIYSVLVKELPAEDIEHHYSDLYVRKTPKSTEIVNRLTTKSLLSTFKDNIDGDIWYELPFCYTPYFGESKNIVETSIPRNATKIKVGGKEFTKEKDWVDGNRVHVSPKDIKRLYGNDVEVLETDPNYKSKRTKEVKVLQGNYGYGWDDLVEYDKEDSAELKQDLKSYRENERNAQFRVVTRRVPLGEDKLIEDAYDDYFGDKGVDYLIGLVKDIAKKGDLRKYNLTQSDFYEVWDGLKELKKNRSFDTIVENVANFIGENSNLLVYSKGNGWHIEVNNMYESKELKEGAKPSELWYNKKEALNNIWGLVCEGDDRLEDIRYIFESGLLKPNEFRYDRFGAKHSLIMGALRNGNYKTAELLKSLGEKILKSEVEEYKDLMARRVYSDETTRDALDEDKTVAKFQDDDQVHEIHDYENGTFANHYDAKTPGHMISYYDSEEEARKQMRRHRPFAKEIKESKKLKEDLTDIKQEWEDFLASGKNNVIEFDDGDYVYFDIDFDRNVIYAGSAANAGILRQYEVYLDPDLNLDENIAELYDEIVWEKEQDEHHSFGKQKIGTLKDGKELFIDTAYGSGYQLCSVDGFGNYNPYSEMGVGNTIKIIDFDTPEDVIEFAKKQYGDRLVLESKKFTKKEKQLKEAKSSKKLIYTIGDRFVAHQLDGVTSPFNREFDAAKKYRDISNDSNFKHGSIGCKGKSYKSGVNQWVKDVEPTEFMVWTKKESPSWKDDVLDVYYRKETVNESKNLKEDWTVFEFTSGSNPYIAKTDKEVKRLLKKYKGRVEWDEYNGNYIVDDKERFGWDKPMVDDDPLPFGPGTPLKEAKGKKVYVVIEIPMDSDIPRLIGVYSSKSAAEKVADSERRRWCNVIETTLEESLTEDLSKIQEEQTMKLVRLLGKGLITKQEFEEKLYGIIEPKLVRAPMFKDTKIKDFYTDNYPEDDLGEEINDTVTVQDVVDLLNDGRGDDFYSLIGVSDSLVRERILAFIADACGVKYDVVYKKWLGESLTESKELTESLDDVDMQKFVDSYKNNYELLSDGINEDAIEFFDRWVAKKKHDNFMKKFAEVNGDYVSSDREAVAFAFTLEDFGLIFESFKTSKLNKKLTERLEPKDLDQIFAVGKEFTLTKPLELEHYIGNDYFDLGPEDYDDEDNLIIRPEKLEEFKNKFIAELKEDEFYDEGVIDNYVVVDKELGDVKLELPAGTKLTVKKNEPNETMFNKNPWFSKVTFTTPNGDFETFYNNPGLLERITKTSK